MSHIVARRGKGRNCCLDDAEKGRVCLLWKRFDVKQDTGQGKRNKKGDKDLRRRMLHVCEQLGPSFVSIFQVPIISPHAHQDARCAAIADMEDGNRLSVYSRTILFLAAGLRPHKAGVPAGELVV